MIKVINDWYITVEANPINYTVRKGDGTKDKKHGWTDKPIAFFGNLRGAVKFIRGQIIAESFLIGSRTLADAIRTITEVDDRFEKIIENIKE